MIMCGCETRALLEPLAAAGVLTRRVPPTEGCTGATAEARDVHHRAYSDISLHIVILIIAGAAMPPTVRYSCSTESDAMCAKRAA